MARKPKNHMDSSFSILSDNLLELRRVFRQRFFLQAMSSGHSVDGSFGEKGAWRNVQTQRPKPHK